ncbi:response regulator [Botrimarina hoheduenensis]|uniref:Sensor histidine kinase RcsC n=1 Tax=Botrimarina hoheduenensis TaxID=2528000 RepID=A0A5C5WBB5_9BACT|nr:response regulator [Botrimarina hoheduenensis]TWT47301.1 Sensor histidine kinase RcsC [Botrimarina hoheduenensis]
MFANRKAVMHVDDDQLITRLVAEQLRAAGYESEAVNDPLLALPALVRGQYRIVLMDIHMPQRSGLQLLSEIKTLDAGIQVIMLTGLVNETTVIEAMRQGAEACLFKPLSDPSVLIDAVDDAYRRNNRWWDSLRDLTQRRRTAETVASA